MSKLTFLQIIIGLFVFGQIACEEVNDIQAQRTKERVKIVLDSIGTSKIIACFIEDGSFSVLEYENEKSKIARKLIYRLGYPVFIDTLTYIKHDEFKSRHFNTTYLIKDSTVLSINYVKIIHPSSNWQGQTPWTQPYVTTYTRVDIDNK